jgi:multidrug efflux pump subunit AcrA (membrane-fusion protein)
VKITVYTLILRRNEPGFGQETKKYLLPGRRFSCILKKGNGGLRAQAATISSRQKNSTAGGHIMEPKRPSRHWLKSKKFIAAILAVLLIVVIVTVVLSGEETYAEISAQRRDITTYYSFTGNIEANHSQSVLATGSEPVQRFYAQEGDRVQPGDLLVEFRNDTLQANLAQSQASAEIAQINYEKAVGSGRTDKTLQAESALITAKANFKTAEEDLARTKQFYENGVSARVELDNAQKTYDAAEISLRSAQNTYDMLETTLDQDARTAAAQLDQSRASLANLERQLAESRIYADVPGTVTEVYVNVNEQVMNGTKILDVIDYDRLEVTVKVDEYGLVSIEEGKEVQVYVNAYGIDAVGTISDISENATVENGVSYFTAVISIEPNAMLRVGMSVEIKVVNESAEGVVAVPMSAVNTDDTYRAYVLVRNEAGKAQPQYVRAGINDGMFIEIKEGLEEGAAVLVSSGGGFQETSGGGAAMPGVRVGPGGGATNVRVGPGGGGQRF